MAGGKVWGKHSTGAWLRRAQPHLYSILFPGGHIYCSNTKWKGLDHLRTNYYDFHQRLGPFLALLKTRSTTKASAVLQQVDFLPKHFPVDDPDFATGDVESLVKKGYAVTDVVILLFKNVEPVDAHKDWFVQQRNEFLLLIWPVRSTLSALSIPLRISAGNHAVVSAGAGGVNIGVNSSPSTESEKKLRQLEDALRDLDKPK